MVYSCGVAGQGQLQNNVPSLHLVKDLNRVRLAGYEKLFWAKKSSPWACRRV